MRKTRLELHHVAGGNNSPTLTATLCSWPCHASLSNREQIWDSRWTRSDNSDALRASFIVNGIYELLLEKFFQTGVKDYLAMASGLPSLIRYYREGC